MNIIYNESINETLYYNKHETGLDIYVLPKSGYSQLYGVFAVRYGSNDSEFIPPDSNKGMTVPDGIAHFLEHKMFEKKEGSVFDDYANLGSSPNAYTNFTTTAYLFSSTGNVKENIDLLLNNVQNPYFTDESIEKEKGIIGQEIRMYQDNPNWKVYFNLLDCLYVKYPVKKEITGSIESISMINKDLLNECYKTFYHPSNAMFVMVGDVNPDEIVHMVTDNIEKHGYEKKLLPRRVYPHEPPELNKKFAEQKLSVANPLFAVGFKDVDVGYDNRHLLKKELETSLILEQLFGRSSSLFRRLYDEGLINNSFSSDYIGEKDYGYSMIGGESKDPVKVCDLLKEEILSRGLGMLKEEKFEMIKRKFMGQFLSSFNSVEYIGSNFVSYYMKKINLLDYIDVVNTVKYEDIVNRFKTHISDKNMAVSIIYPSN